MAPALPNGYLTATLIWDHAGDPDPYTVTLAATDDTTHNATSQAVAISGLWTAGFSAAANMTVGYTFRGVDVKLMRAGVETEGLATVNVAGTYAVGAAPQNVALLVKKNTGLTGRKNRGRAYLPPCYVDEGGINDNGIILAATLTTLNTRLATFYTAMIANLNSLVILHSDGSTPTGLASFVLEAQVATQRRRLR